jgi:hypothetical protein
MAKKKSARQTAARDVTGVPSPAAGPAPNAGVVKRVVKGGATAPKGLHGGKGQK